MERDENQLCPDCGANVGEFHTPGCDVERCAFCGGQAISCGCAAEVEEGGETELLDGLTLPRLRWTGIWPGKVECREFGWYCRMIPGVMGWQPCGPDDEGARENLNRLYEEAVWSREAGRFVLRKAEGQPPNSPPDETCDGGGGAGVKRGRGR